jgi:hypothetical protein
MLAAIPKLQTPEPWDRRSSQWTITPFHSALKNVPDTCTSEPNMAGSVGVEILSELALFSLNIRTAAWCVLVILAYTMVLGTG